MAFKQPPAASGWPPWTLLASEPDIESTLKHCQTTDKVCCSYNPFVSACMAVGQFPHNFSLNSRTQIEEKEGGSEGWREWRIENYGHRVKI